MFGQDVARSYAQLVTSEVVLRPAAQRIGWVDLQSFTRLTQAAQVRDTSIITISFSASRTAAQAWLLLAADNC